MERKRSPKRRVNVVYKQRFDVTFNPCRLLRVYTHKLYTYFVYLQVIVFIVGKDGIEQRGFQLDDGM